MITVKCPECSAGLHVSFKDQAYHGWKACKNCGVPSLVKIESENAYTVKSLHAMIQECKERKMVAEALYYIMNRGGAYVEDLYFNIGKKMETDMNLLLSFSVVKRTGNHFEIAKGLEPFLMKEIKPFLPKSNENGNFLSKLDI